MIDSPMRRALMGFALVASCVPATTARGQERSQPQLLLTILAGASSASKLYEQVRQPLVLFEDPFATDTLQLGRRLSTAVILGASASYFPSSHLGFTGEIAFLGYGRDDDCDLAYTDPTVARLGYTEQICGDIAAQGGSASIIAFRAGALLRAAPRGTVKPYLRAQAGITTRSASTVEVAGRYLDNTGVRRSRLIIADDNAGGINPTATLGLGAMFGFAPGYQARLELRDNLLFVDRITGPANALQAAPQERTLLNNVALVFMLDIVLEQRRGRRY